ncbi:MAG: hypothetical protein C7B43_16605 [Sulfobacillus benefaciens]|uniref:Uncharacterized protein n=1 Tax=Sulfobacillus benefaciens TaxID=453960 RepID=A0A2T2WTG6_9FIRM|nr:MAG: hypothetical protein C7B43_16605 [Sulfobacillus benefaciens]
MITTISRRSRFPAPSILSATLSPTGHAIQSQGWGLRNNAYSETSMTDLDTILRGEIAMGNIDIIDFVWRQYGWLADYGWGDVPEEEWWIIAQDNAPDIAADILTHCCAVWSLSRSMPMAGFRSRRWVRFPHIPAKVNSRKASEDRRPFYFVLKIPKNPSFIPPVTTSRHQESSNGADPMDFIPWIDGFKVSLEP